MRRRRNQESGQAVVLLALAMVFLVAFAALAIDGGRLYAETRHAQNAADNAALAAAWAKCLGEDFTSAALLLASENGYDNDGTANIVTVANPPTTGPYSGNSEYVEVTIVSNFHAVLMQFIRPGGLQITARATGSCLEGISQGHAAVHTVSQTCSNAILWSGNSCTVQGGLHSNNDILISGSDNLVEGIASYVTTIDAPADKVAFDPPAPDNPVRTRVLDDPLGLDIEAYAPGGPKAAIALGVGLYYYLDGDMDLHWLRTNGYYDMGTHVLSDGLYYATGDISIIGPDVTGAAVTFVAEGEIRFAGPTHIMSSFMDDLLAFTPMAREGESTACSSPVIKLSLSSNVYEGLLYAPYGNINVSGSDIQITGGLIAYAISLTGSGISVTNSSEFFPPLPGTIEITE